MTDVENSLPVMYHDWLEKTLDANGFPLPHGILRTADGAITMAALAVPPDQAYRVMLSLFEREQMEEAIFALDRYALPGQGTALCDLMAGWHLRRSASPTPFIVEYRYDPRVVCPFDHDNAYWNAALTRELLAAIRRHTDIRLDGSQPAGTD